LTWKLPKATYLSLRESDFGKGSSLIEKNRSLIKDKLGKIQEEEKIQKE